MKRCAMLLILIICCLTSSTIKAINFSSIDKIGSQFIQILTKASVLKDPMISVVEFVNFIFEKKINALESLTTHIKGLNHIFLVEIVTKLLVSAQWTFNCLNDFTFAAQMPTKLEGIILPNNWKTWTPILQTTLWAVVESYQAFVDCSILDDKIEELWGPADD